MYGLYDQANTCLNHFLKRNNPYINMPNYSSEDIARLARQFGYHQLQMNQRDEGRMVSWRHEQKCGGVRINIYISTGTVATCLDHPRVGKGQLFRYLCIE